MNFALTLLFDNLFFFVFFCSPFLELLLFECWTSWMNPLIPYFFVSYFLSLSFSSPFWNLSLILSFKL